MQEELWFTALLNHAFARPVNAVMQALPPIFHPKNPAAPISDPVAMEILVVAFLIVLFLLIRSLLTVEKPGFLQHIAEITDQFITNQSKEIIGPHSEKFTPFLLALFVFILFSNLIGLIPSLESPTATGAVPLGCAVVAFIYYNLHGLKVQGPVKFVRHFMGPIWWLAALMFPIEIISTLARVMSLSIRLYANMFAGDMVIAAFFVLIPIGIPVIFLFLHVFVSFLQAYIFALLNMIYLQGVVTQEH
ncbi:MAG TPA: F0F1 ATP synthase subunit A [Candidatus Angelobacter sp.]|nr:F0F1 ATP synthase subunit A [Candidatus Angelobacter sp.]